MMAHAFSVRGACAHLGVARRWGLFAVVGVAAMVPWYSLRLFPLITVGTAKINLLDALVGATVLAALPSVMPLIRNRNTPVLWVMAFMLYLLVPLTVGLRDPNAAPTAVREFRPLAFYALALAFGAEGSSASDVQAFSRAFVGGACVAIAAVFVHLRWLVGLPGYTPDALLAPPGFAVQSFSWNEHVSPVPTVPVAAAVGYRVEYLDRTVPLVSFVLSVLGMLTASSRWARALWGMSAVATAWYLLASGARSSQIIALGVAIVLSRMPWPCFSLRRVLVVVALLAAAAGAIDLGLGSHADLRSLSGPIRTTLLRWSQARADDSLQLRVKEIMVSLPQFVRHPIIGDGLGAVIPLPVAAEGNGQSPRTIASGYGFLLIKTGLLGILLYMMMVGSILRLGWRRIREDADGNSRSEVLTGVVGLAVLLALNLVHKVADIPEGVVAFSLFFGMIVPRHPHHSAASRGG